MTTVLITAFEPYGQWDTNASWLCLMELTRQLPAAPVLTTRRYPVDFVSTRERLEADLRGNYDFALHLGQAPGSAAIRLEQFAVNIGQLPGQSAEEFFPLCTGGPAAYRSTLPLDDWSRRLRSAGIPAAVSHHAGTYLCNATLYWSHYLAERHGWKTRSAFVHLPLETSQCLGGGAIQPSLPAAMMAQGVLTILDELASLT
jgi:pyroglutamyl-peptidase